MSSSLINSIISTTSAGSNITINGGYSSASSYNYFSQHEPTFDDLYNQVSDSTLPVVPQETWEKIMPMLESKDIELVKLAFGFLNGYRFPKGILNYIIISKGINTYLRNL